MIILITEEGRKTKITINGLTTEYRTTFLDKLSYKDFKNYVKSRT